MLGGMWILYDEYINFGFRLEVYFELILGTPPNPIVCGTNCLRCSSTAVDSSGLRFRCSVFAANSHRLY